MTEQLTEFNPFEFMDTQEEINEFLVDCYQDEDPNTFVTALGQLYPFYLKMQDSAGIINAFREGVD